MEVDFLLQLIKSRLSITWEDEITNFKLLELMDDAKITLDHKLGAEIDYSIPGMERNLYINYCLYIWNDCSNDFDKNYLNEIYQIRNKYKVKKYVEKNK